MSCRNTWTARPEDGEIEPWEEAKTEPVAAPAPEPSPPESNDSEPPPAPADDPLLNFDPVIPSARQVRKPARRSGPSLLLVWAGAAAVLAVIALTLALFRNNVVRLWPKTAALYAAAGMSVNGVGLVIEGVRLTPAVRNGQAVLGVAGKIRNERDHPTPAAPLQLTFYGANGAELGKLVARPVDVVPPLESRYFSVLVQNPPPGVASVSLVFVSHAPPPSPASTVGKDHGSASAAAPAAAPDAPATPDAHAAPSGDAPPPGAAPHAAAGHD